MNYYVYIVRCRDNSLYTGVTWNIEKRINEHNTSKLGAKSVKGKLPVRLAYSERFKNKIEAFRREREIKGWRKDKKETLIETCACAEESIPEALALRSVAKKRW